MLRYFLASLLVIQFGCDPVEDEPPPAEAGSGGTPLDEHHVTHRRQARSALAKADHEKDANRSFIWRTYCARRSSGHAFILSALAENF